MADAFDDMEMGTDSTPLYNPDDRDYHKVAVFFHLFFKALAFFVYTINILSLEFVMRFVVCVLLMAADFWTVKNVTGRLLVGLRWWNEVKDNGETHWIFESKPDNRFVHPFDQMVFWTALVVTPIIWGIIGIIKIIGLFPTGATFGDLLFAVVGFTLSVSNFIGYYKCQGDAKRHIQRLIAQRL